MNRSGNGSAWRLATIFLLVAACDQLTEVDAPGVVLPGALENAVGAEARRVGVIGQFATGFAGAATSQVMSSALISDELSTGIPTGIFAATDMRVIVDPSALYPHQTLQRVRVDASQAIAALEQFAPNPASRIGELFALSGYVKIFLGENVCAGVPLSDIVDGRVVFGTPLTINEMFEASLADFDAAVAHAQDSARILNLARVGRGRALLNLGRFSEAANAVTPVPTSHVYQVEFLAGTTNPNSVYTSIVDLRGFSVSDREGVNGLDYISADDPRVPTRVVGPGLGGRTIYALTTYTSANAPIILASGVEARLIEAEAALQAGDASGALALLNALRQTMPGLAPLTQASTTEERVDQLFRERAFWLFLTGHRHGDLRRLIRQYGRVQDAVFPSGQYDAARSYGADVTFTMETGEANNPNYRGCLNREA